MELVPGKKYNYLIDGALIEVIYIEDRVVDKINISYFECTKTKYNYACHPDVLEKTVSDIPIDSKDGVKWDEGKLLWGLLPLEPIREIVRVLTYGAKKYAPSNWMNVKDARERYYDAMMRHIVAYKMGETKDSDTNIHPLAHAGCCLLFILWFELFPEKEK